MADKKKAIISVLVIAAIIIALAVSVHLINSIRTGRMIEQYTQNNLELYSELNVISDCANVDGNPYSLAGIKEAVRLGVDTVTLDLCFKSDGTPVITDDYTNISGNTLKAEDVFILLNEDEYNHININFRLRQLSSLSFFNRLINEYDVSKRVILSGIDADRYSLISGTDTPAKVYFDYIPSDTVEYSVSSVNSLISDYNLGGVIIEAEYATKELVDALSQKGISYIISSVDKELDMYCVMSYGAYAIETDSPSQLKEAYNSWKDITLQRLDASILNELNK